ncbi:pantetheine-phosphate adenylyltransferase [Mycoplasmopsis agassizii]|uniref:Phosphopantetheine adenylyltransferase n=1 Tax=Mycoplasmopsis agassizii TaxID=33922 RepID=A0A269TJA5_9BACT|nr:pantetheine-phosphate adenylyltransferase [Mycoplasmopsis agassizii]PAK21491.1 pantetheine-phosphate adenylyltransferase [Mycoplasmopsis agassizii]
MTEKRKIAIFPGSFNPFHRGHFLILKKALKLFDFIYVVITQNPDKTNSDYFDQAQKNIKKLITDQNLENVKVLINKNKFTAHLAKELGATFLIRSARNVIDYNYETELAAGNKMLNNDLETIIIFPDFEGITFSSTLERHQKYLDKKNTKKP